ncbi:MAG: nitroreductase family protein, partial [Chloroflexota bacterium]
HLLTTTRSVRKRLDLDRPVERAVIERCLEIAIQAPTGSNAQGWRFVVVADPHKRATIARLYKKSFFEYVPQSRNQPAEISSDATQMERVISSAAYLAQNMHKVPILILACIKGRVEKMDQMTQAGFYGSILPAAWSLMLAFRARGLGSAWTTLHLRYADEVANLLDIPDRYTQAALVPVAYYKGEDFKPAARVPAKELTSWDSWS